MRNVSDIWYMLKDSDSYLYHYTRAETLAEHILPSRTLRPSPFRQLNDPRENKDFSLSGADWGDDLNGGVLDELSQILKTDWRVTCFVRDIPEAAFDSPNLLGAEQLQAMHERGHSRPRMWAQYGGNHTGACLVFDKAALNKAFNAMAKKTGLQALSGAVLYENVRIARSLEVGPFIVAMNDVRNTASGPRRGYTGSAFGANSF